MMCMLQVCDQINGFVAVSSFNHFDVDCGLFCAVHARIVILISNFEDTSLGRQFLQQNLVDFICCSF